MNGHNEIVMNGHNVNKGRVFGWLCLGLSILLLALYGLKSPFAADRDVSPALVIIGMALLISGAASLRSAKKASQNE